MSLESLPLAYRNEISALNHEILTNQPADVLQYCANFFNRRLESERTQFLRADNRPASSASPSPGTMAVSAFPGSNPFGGPAVGSTTGGGGGSSIFGKIAEEEEDDELMSPSHLSFHHAHAGPPSSSAPGHLFSGPGGFGAGSGNSGGASDQSVFSVNSPFYHHRGGTNEGHGDDPDPSAPPPFRPPPDGVPGLPSNYSLGRRTSVSAESLNPTSSGSDSWNPPYHPKTEEQLARLTTAVSNNFLFSHLDDDQFKTVLDALVEKPIPARDIKVITQGDAGDYFYVVEEGHFDVYIHPSGSAQPGLDGLGHRVATIGPGGSFGELALMYNAPRAATVVSTDPRSTLWALDRVTFRRILMDSAFQRRRMYEAFLEEVPLLLSLKPYERSKIADALDTIKHPAGSTIITEGDPGDAFYLLESGEAEAFKRGTEGPVKSYRRGDYFGELALLDDKPRAASVVAKTDVKVARLGRDGFKRLLGPVEQIMRRADYDVDPLSKIPAQ